MNIAVSTLMHGRHATCDEALKKNIDAGLTDFYYAYTTEDDLKWCRSNRVSHVRERNSINLKAQASLDICFIDRETLSIFEPDAVLLMGSDDWVDGGYVDIVSDLLKHYDYIAPLNCYFKSDGSLYLWPGYPQTSSRHGEPCGAGKVVRVDLLDELEWEVFSGSDKATDLTAHNRIMSKAKNPIFIDIVQRGVKLVDIKDSESTTPISRFNYLQKI